MPRRSSRSAPSLARQSPGYGAGTRSAGGGFGLRHPGRPPGRTPGPGLGAAGSVGLHRTERLVPIKKDPFPVPVSMPGEFGFSCPTLRRKGGVSRMGNAPFLMPRYSPLPEPDQALGKVKRNLEPMWSLLSTSIFSPCDSMMCLTMESPSPEPPLSRERLLSTR